MTEAGTTTDDLLRRAKAGDTAALGALFAHYRDRLRKMVRLRLDRRMAGRLDASDVLQEAYLDAAGTSRSMLLRRRCRSTSGCGRWPDSG